MFVHPALYCIKHKKSHNSCNRVVVSPKSQDNYLIRSVFLTFVFSFVFSFLAVCTQLFPSSPLLSFVPLILSSFLPSFLCLFFAFAILPFVSFTPSNFSECLTISKSAKYVKVVRACNFPVKSMKYATSLLYKRLFLALFKIIDVEYASNSHASHGQHNKKSINLSLLSRFSEWI